MVANPKKTGRSALPWWPKPRRIRQVERYLWLSEQGWKAYQAEKRATATVILLHKGKRYAPLYPDGSFDPPVELKGKVRIDWTRAAEGR